MRVTRWFDMIVEVHGGLLDSSSRGYGADGGGGSTREGVTTGAGG